LLRFYAQAVLGEVSIGKTRGFAAIREIVTLGILQKMEPCLVNNHSSQNILKQKRDKRRGEQRRGKGLGGEGASDKVVGFCSEVAAHAEWLFLRIIKHLTPAPLA